MYPHAVCRSLRFWRHVNVEPALFFYFLSYLIVDFLNTNLYLQKVSCNATQSFEPRSTGGSDAPCDDEKAALTYIATVYTNWQFVSGLLTNIFTMYACIYSDLVGRRRKPFIILPIVALLLQILSACLQVIHWKWDPLVGIFLNTLLSNLGGGLTCFMIFVKVYMCDQTANENRHMRITLLVTTRALCNVIGKGVSGHLLHHVGFLHSYLICALLTAVSLLLAVVLIADHSDGRATRLADVFSVRELARSFRIIVLSKKLVRHRATIIILLLMCILVYFNTMGESSVFYLYFRYRFHWDERQFSNFSAYKVVTGLVGGVLCTLVMSKLMKVHDGIIGTFAAFMDTVAAAGFFFASQEWQLYSVPLLDMFHGIALSTCYSFISKFFTDQEFGRLHSMHMLFNLATAFGLPAYSLLFRSTMDTIPNAFYLLSVLLNAVICVSYRIYGGILSLIGWFINPFKVRSKIIPMMHLEKPV